MEDNGSLAFLNIKVECGSKQFNCNEIKQSQLANREFWLIDYIKDIKTKYGEGRYLIKIKFNKDDADDLARKFFTNSKEIKYILDKIEEFNAFPRKVTLSVIGNNKFTLV